MTPEDNDYIAQFNTDFLKHEKELQAKLSSSTPKIFSQEQYSALLSQTIAQIQSLSKLKGGEYAGDVDRLANFRRNGERLGLPMETIWAVYAAKHWDAVLQYVQDSQAGRARTRGEPLAGRLDDIIVYCILFKAMLEERGEGHPANQMKTEN